MYYIKGKNKNLPTIDRLELTPSVIREGHNSILVSACYDSVVHTIKGQERKFMNVELKIYKTRENEYVEPYLHTYSGNNTTSATLATLGQKVYAKTAVMNAGFFDNGTGKGLGYLYNSKQGVFFNGDYVSNTLRGAREKANNTTGLTNLVLAAQHYPVMIINNYNNKIYNYCSAGRISWLDKNFFNMHEDYYSKIRSIIPIGCPLIYDKKNTFAIPSKNQEVYSSYGVPIKKYDFSVKDTVSTKIDDLKHHFHPFFAGGTVDGDITGVTQRSAIGLVNGFARHNENNAKYIYFVATPNLVDVEFMSYVMEALGCHYAANLDGGGSTQYDIYQQDGYNFDRRPIIESSDSSKVRPVANVVIATFDYKQPE